jgi:hypothetical protein
MSEILVGISSSGEAMKEELGQIRLIKVMMLRV